MPSPLSAFRPSFDHDADDWAEARTEVPASPCVAWCWDACELGSQTPFGGKWPIETRPFVLCDESASEQRGVPTIDLFVYSDPSPRLYTDLRRAYGSGSSPLRGMCDLFRDRASGVTVTLTEMIPLVLGSGDDLGSDARALRASVDWSHPAQHERFLFSLLRIETTYAGDDEDEEHLALYSPLPPHRVVEAVLPALRCVAPTYVLDAGRNGVLDARGPASKPTMRTWLETARPRFVMSTTAALAGYEPRARCYPWPLAAHEEGERPRWFELG